MNAADDALPRAPPWSTQAAGVPNAAVSRLLVYAVCTVAALAGNYALGVDSCWDTLNYHLYAGLSAVHDRLEQDYFAAGPQSYFNPYVYAPFYVLVSSGLPALAISSILAVVHSTVLWLTYELACRVCDSSDRRIQLMNGVCAVALAFLNPILIQQIGSSFADITTAALVLCGWLLLTRAVRASQAVSIVFAGFLLGAATALKLTNAVHALAAFTLVLMLPRLLNDRMRYGLVYASGLGAGFAMFAVPWAMRLTQRFGNPFFPLLNTVFRSPEFTTEPLHHYRFVPGSIWEALWRPFAMLNPVPMVHDEPSAPDLRYAALLVLVGVVAVRWLWRYRPRESEPPHSAEQQESTRILTALGCALAVDWVLWLSASGNSRYFLPMASVAAVIVVALVFREFASQPRVGGYILGAILGIQVLQLWLGAEYRWDPLPWGGPWFKVEMPAELTTKSSLELTVGVQSNSFLAAYLPEGSALVNFSGGYALGADGANGATVRALLERYRGHVRVLLPGSRLYEDAEQRVPLRSQVDDVLERFDLRVEASDCAHITVRGVPPPVEIRIVGKGAGAVAPPSSRDSTQLLSCLAVPGVSPDRGAHLERQRVVDLVLDRLEDACPELFQPRRLQTEHIGSRWQRYYMNTDLMAWVSRGEVKFHDLLRDDGLIYLGRETDWTKAPLRLACGRRDGHYFAKVLPSSGGS